MILTKDNWVTKTNQPNQCSEMSAIVFVFSDVWYEMLVSRQSSTLSTSSKETITTSTAHTATMFILAALNKILADKYGQEGDEVEERHVVYQINSALNDILVEGLDRKDGEDIFSFLEGSQKESKQGS